MKTNYLPNGQKNKIKGEIIMQKTKIISFVLTTAMLAIVILTAFFALNIGGHANAETQWNSSEELFSLTNTYDCTSVNYGDDYSINYDLSSSGKNRNQVMDIPQITVLTHGLGGSAAHWSNQYNGGRYIKFEFDADSLIEKLREKSGAAQMYKVENNEIKCEYDDTVKDKITDNSKHIIIVFESSNPNGSNNRVYQEFNHAISNIVLQVKQLNGGILPKLNLIGHSRGGLTNMQYALDHPDMVASLISIGTPYFSSTTANLFGEMFMGEDQGLADILDSQVYMQYYRRWNDNYDSLYKKINAVAIGGYSSLTMLPLILTKDKSGELKDNLGMSDAELKALAAAAEVALAYIAGLKTVNFNEAITMAGLTRVLESIFPQDKIVDAITILTREMGFTYNPPFTAFFNDMLVSLDSQWGIHDVVNTHIYKGFKRYKKFFTSTNTNFNKVAEAMPPVVHNLEPRDAQIIKWVCNEVVLGSVEPGYRYQKLNDANIAVTGFFGSLEDTEVVIPSQIDGYQVTEIGDYAFNESWFSDNMTKVVIPQSVTKIGQMAFADCKALQSIEFDGLNNIRTIKENAFCGCISVDSIPEFEYLTEIAEGAFAGSSIKKLDLSTSSLIERVGYGAFKDCKNLEEVILGDGVKQIYPYAFYGCQSLASVDIPASVEFIGDQAFADCTALSDVNVDAANASYTSIDGVLFSKDLETLLQYPIGKNQRSYILLDAVRNIASGAFYNSSIEDVHFNRGLKVIGEFAFANNSALDDVVVYEMIISIDPFAFANCKLLRDITLYSDRTNSVKSGAFDNIDPSAQFFVPNRAISDYAENSAIEKYADDILPITYTLRYYDGNTFLQEKQMCYLEEDKYEIIKDGYDFDHWEVKNTGGAFNYEQFIMRDSTVEVEAFWRIKHFVIYVKRDGESGYLKITDGHATIVETPTYVEYGAKAKIKETIAQWYWEAVKYLGQKLVDFKFSPIDVKMPDNGHASAAGSTWVEWDDYDYKEIFEYWNSILEEEIPDFDLEFMAILVTPIFETKQFTFVLDANGGKLTGANEVKLNYGDSFSISAPTRLGYDFAYWTIVSLTPTSTRNDYNYKGKRFVYQTVPDMSVNIPLDSIVILRAEWDRFHYIDAKTISGNEISGYEHIWVDFQYYYRYYIVDKVFKVPTSVKKIYIQNMKSLYRVAFEFSGQQVVLDNCSFTAPINTDAIRSLTSLDLYFVGSNTVQGGMKKNNKVDGTVALGTGIQTGVLELHAGSESKNDTLKIYGGSGYGGEEGSTYGKDGGEGIFAIDLYIYSGNVYVYGGNGGRGADGIDGASSSKSGASGGRGGLGGNAVNLVGSNFKIYQGANVYLYGGNGGDGGNGGRGADGRNGKFGVPAQGGGDGGNGGRGGDSGKGVSSVLASGYEQSATIVNGTGGTGGRGGLGGIGGLKYITNNPTPNGTNGTNGSDGRSK